MEELEYFKNAVESEVESYFDDCDCDRDYLDQDIDLEFDVDGHQYGCSVSARAYFSYSDYTETDKFGIEYKLGQTRELESVDFDFIDLFEIMEDDDRYIVKQNKQVA